MGARIFKSTICFSSIVTWPIELEFRKMILNIGVQSRSVPDFAISSQGAPFETFSFYLLPYYGTD